MYIDTLRSGWAEILLKELSLQKLKSKVLKQIWIKIQFQSLTVKEKYSYMFTLKSPLEWVDFNIFLPSSAQAPALAGLS